MSERDVLEARIERQRDELAATLEEISAGARARARIVRAKLDVRRRIRRRPAAWLAGALVLGFWFGARR